MSFEFSISPKDKSSAEFMTHVHQVLMREMIKAAKEQKLKRSDVARLLNVDKSVVTRALDGKANLTLRTLAELCWAIGVEPEFDACKKASDFGCNHEPVSMHRPFVPSFNKAIRTNETAENSKKKIGFGQPSKVKEVHHAS